MKQLINGEVREMADEEVAEYLQMIANTEPPLEDKAEALTRYANFLTGANDPDLISAAETLITERIKEES